ncbi:MAG: hypothetical protein ABFD85_00535 [Phycisphaerae bacterium]
MSDGATICGDGVVAAMMVKDYFRNPETWAQKAAPESGLVEGW